MSYLTQKTRTLKGLSPDKPDGLKNYAAMPTMQ